jgi:hypothetical protein
MCVNTPILGTRHFQGTDPAQRVAVPVALAATHREPPRARLRLWDTAAVPDLETMWSQADAALLRCLELAHQSFLAGGPPVGSVIVTGGGRQVSEGRNRAYDPAGGADRLQRAQDEPRRGRGHRAISHNPSLHRDSLPILPAVGGSWEA